MAVSSVPLTALSEDQRAQAHTRFTIIRPALEDGITQAQVARTHNISKSTIQRWVKRYRENGLAGLADAKVRSDKGKSRRLPAEAVTLIEGLALQTPPRSIAAIYRQVSTIAGERGWKVPSYDSVYRIIKKLDPALLTLAHQGAAAYREEYDLLYRREATHSNAKWQADHTPLDVLLLDEAGKPARPWLTVIEDDYSRSIAALRLTFQEPTALTTALALRQAIWRKEDPHWQICGIPSVFYTDHGSDFTSKHMEQVAADLGIELIFSEKGGPCGRGKIERFFRSVNELFLQDVPGYAPKGYQKEEVLIRYDPVDLAEIHVFYQDRFLCRAICQELSGQTVSLKEIEKARSERRKQVRVGLSTREAVVEHFLAVHQEEAPRPKAHVPEPETE